MTTTITALVRIARRYRAAEERLAGISAEREQAIRQAHASGMPMRAIAEHTGLSHQRIAQIVNRPEATS
jgi:hypothetical protein